MPAVFKLVSEVDSPHLKLVSVNPSNQDEDHGHLNHLAVGKVGSESADEIEVEQVQEMHKHAVHVVAWWVFIRRGALQLPHVWDLSANAMDFMVVQEEKWNLFSREKRKKKSVEKLKLASVYRIKINSWGLCSKLFMFRMENCWVEVGFGWFIWISRVLVLNWLYLRRVCSGKETELLCDKRGTTFWKYKEILDKL